MTNSRATSDHALIAEMRKDARAIFEASLRAADPAAAVQHHCFLDSGRLMIGGFAYSLDTIKRIFVVGAGKATAPMAQAVERVLGDRIHEGVISVKYDHAAPLKRIRTIEAGHPIPDANGMNAARSILDLAKQAGKDDLLIMLISGGGSALLPLPCESLALRDKQIATDLLIACGASIHEINTVRKHLSAIKGGRLAQAARPARVATLILSDVVGDDLDVIASGPTVPDRSTFADCLRIVEHYQLLDKLPAAVARHLERGFQGQAPETPKPDDRSWDSVQNLIVASNSAAVRAAASEALSRGYTPMILSSRIQGETRVVAQVHGAIAREVHETGNPLQPPACLLSGGETTVSMNRQHGLGGRNQEFCLAAAREIDGLPYTIVLSAGTDGSDGPTDAAGAICDHTSIARSAQLGLDDRHHLYFHDAYHFLEKTGDLLKTGPTQTNVMDIRLILIRKD